MKRIMLLLLVVGCSAAESPGPYAGAHLANVTSYDVHPTRTTPGGTDIDDPQHQVDDTVLDSLTNRVEACLASLPEPTQTERAAMNCLPGRLPRSLDRRGWNVKVAPDWYRSSCHPEQELFPCDVDPMLCDAAHLAEKGLTPCPGVHKCACRAIVQDNHTVVTAPFLLVYAGELPRLVTTCNTPWSGPLAECANTYP